jgi:hypothetical protein
MACTIDLFNLAMGNNSIDGTAREKLVMPVIWSLRYTELITSSTVTSTASFGGSLIVGSSGKDFGVNFT